MALIFDSGMKTFPPRLPEQPIFYPVLNPSYAEQIAREWNAHSESQAGYVTRFEVPDDLAAKYPRQQVGGADHEEWWVPAEDLPAFNQTIQGCITVETAFFGSGFRGWISDQAGLKDKDATEQFVGLARHLGYSSFDVWCETYVNRKCVFLHYPFWDGLDEGTIGITRDEKQKLLAFIASRWAQSDMPFTLPKRPSENSKS